MGLSTYYLALLFHFNVLNTECYLDCCRTKWTENDMTWFWKHLHVWVGWLFPTSAIIVANTSAKCWWYLCQWGLVRLEEGWSGSLLNWTHQNKLLHTTSRNWRYSTTASRFSAILSSTPVTCSASILTMGQIQNKARTSGYSARFPRWMMRFCCFISCLRRMVWRLAAVTTCQSCASGSKSIVT